MKSSTTEVPEVAVGSSVSHSHNIRIHQDCAIELFRKHSDQVPWMLIAFAPRSCEQSRKFVQDREVGSIQFLEGGLERVQRSDGLLFTRSATISSLVDGA